MAKIYHTTMADALPSKKRVAEEKARLEKAGVKYILSCWIDMLEVDGRKPFNEIAKSLEISEGTVRNRVNRMKDAGVLQIKALVDRSAINYATDSMLGIKVASTSSPTEVAKRLQDCNEIVFIIWVTGRYDLLVEIASEGDETLTRFLDEHCFNNDDIKDVEVMKGLATYKNQFLLKSHEKL